ncbi:NAD(P)/FAD-dependent oxidoreductase [soil metagenome]
MSGGYDAIVVGGGHNGLVCAAYLARDGQRVLVLERRQEPGGMAATSEILPGVRVPTLAHTVGRLRPRVARELNLREHGLALIGPEVRAYAPALDGAPGVTLSADIGRTVGELTELASRGVLPLRDAAAYADADRQLLALGSGMGALMGRVPPDIAHPSLADALSGLAAGARAHSEGGGLLRVLPMAVADLVGEWFASDALRALVAARGVQYTAFGPPMPGTAQVLITDAAGHGGGIAGQSIIARGGPGSLGAALAASAMAFGAEVRLGAEVVRVTRRGDHVAGVALASGEEIGAPVVVSGLDPKRTLLGLLEPEVLGPRLSWRASNIRSAGATAKVNLALAGLPQFSSLAGMGAHEQAVRLRGRVVFAPTVDWLERATREAKYGRLPEAPYMEATIPTLLDRTLLNEGRRGRAAKVEQVMSVIVQAAPYELRDGGWDDARHDELGGLVVATLERFAPDLGKLVVERQVITPLDIERDWGATGGHPMHAEIGLDQWFAWRPLHGYGRYRMPLAGLYLCASGAHPGGGVTGVPGMLAAQEVLADLKSGRLARPEAAEVV